MALSRHERTRRKVDLNPLEMIERVVSDNDWPFDRTSDREIAVEVAGRWCDYRMFFSWRDDVEALHFTCAYDVRIPTERHNDIHVLLALINEKSGRPLICGPTRGSNVPPRHPRGTTGLMPEQLNDPSKWRSARASASIPPSVCRGRQDALDALTADPRDGRRSLSVGTFRRPSKNYMKRS
jgi:hypothetical protein